MPQHTEEQTPELPAFGSRIEFRPRKKPRQQPKAEAKAAVSTHTVLGLAQDDEDVLDAEQVTFCTFGSVFCISYMFASFVCNEARQTLFQCEAVTKCSLSDVPLYVHMPALA